MRMPARIDTLTYRSHLLAATAGALVFQADAQFEGIRSTVIGMTILRINWALLALRLLCFKSHWFSRENVGTQRG